MPKKPVKDVFGFWLLDGASFSENYEFPIIKGTNFIPEKLVPFSNLNKETDTQNKTIHFYELDEKFFYIFDEKSELDVLIESFKNFQSVILPDFSVYRDMPLAMQIWSIYKNHAVGNYLMQKGIKVIPNIRWGDERTYPFVFEGYHKHEVVAVGSQGGYRDNTARFYFEKGFYEMVNTLHLSIILCYGTLSEDLKHLCLNENIEVKYFPTEISKRFPRSCDNSQQPLLAL